jgi:tripartite-type tricarboxylate transporter receptor subunit TctC
MFFSHLRSYDVIEIVDDIIETRKKFNINVRLVLFKSNYDALINMVGNHGINFTVERLVNAENYKKINQNLKVLGYSCNVRHKEKLNVRTLREQGLDVPPVFNILLSSKNMDGEKVDRIRNLFNTATRKIGYDSLSELSDMRSSVFDNIDAVQYFDRRILEFRELRKKHQNNLND